MRIGEYGDLLIAFEQERAAADAEGRKPDFSRTGYVPVAIMDEYVNENAPVTFPIDYADLLAFWETKEPEVFAAKDKPLPTAEENKVADAELIDTINSGGELPVAEGTNILPDSDELPKFDF